MRFKGDGIAATGDSDGGDDKVGRAVATDDFRTLLVIALGAADGAGVEGGGEGMVGPLDDDEADVDALIVESKAMEVAVCK